ncbi:MAG: hypothetical protein IKJ65_09575 [Clostridia bacterium]|nr:hypothetical protein [Clostridia bacterium]
MAELKRIRIRRKRASFPAFVLAFLVFSIVFFLSTAGVKKEKAVHKTASPVRQATKEIALEDLEFYLVALTDGDRIENTRISSARYMLRGAAGYLFEKDGKWYSIGNVYFSREEAERMTAHLLDNGIEASVLPIAQKGATLRVTAEEETLDALSFCLSAFSAFEKSLADYSLRLDAGELSEREARVLLSVLGYDLSGGKAEAKRAIAASGDNAVYDIFRAYLHLLDDLSSLTKNEGGEMMLSARIKYVLIDNEMIRMNHLRKIHA